MWEASGLFPDKLKKFEREIEDLQKEVENHEEILVDLQGYGSGIGRWGSVGRGRSKASSRSSKRENRPSRTNERTGRGSRRERDPYVDDGNERAADGEDSSSSSRRSEDGEEEVDEDEDEDEEDVAGDVSGRNAPAPDAAHVSTLGLNMPRHRDVSATPPRSALRRVQLTGVIEQQAQVTRSTTPLLPGPESPKTTKNEKPRFRFRKGVKAYINEYFDYKVDQLVDEKVEKRLALERSKEPSRAPASGVSNRNVRFPEGVKPADLSPPGPLRSAHLKPNSKRLVAKVAQPQRPQASKIRTGSPYRARPRMPAPALYRVGSSRPEAPTSRGKSGVPDVVVGVEPKVGNLGAEERGGQEEGWVDDVEEEEQGKEYIDEEAEVVEDGASDADSMGPNDGFSDADADVYKDSQSMARIRDFGPAPDANAFGAVQATVEDDVTSNGTSVDPVQLVRDLWPNPAPRRPLKRRHGFINARTV